jgi:hypothetical protein
MDGTTPLKGREAALQQLLDRLCVQLGLCLPPADQAGLVQQPRDSADAFTKAVFEAEGLDADTADRHLYRQVRNMVRETFRQLGMVEIEGDAP